MAATFIPIPYNDLDNLILSQFSSVIVTPDAKPNTGDCTPAEYADLQTSLLFTTTDGADAVGTDLSVTTVPDTVVFVSALINDLVIVNDNKNVITHSTIAVYSFIVVLVFFNYL